MRGLAVALILGLVLLGCASDDDTGGGFAVSADQLTRPAAEEPADPWLVDVATVRPEINPIVAHRRLPGASDADEAEADPVPVAAPEPVPALTPIPSPELSWDSTAVPEGWAFDNPTKIGSPRVFVVVEDAGDWLRVMMPTRPNQEEGWIRASEVDRSTHRWHVEINVAENQIRVWDGDELRISSATVDGKPSTPTPLGRFYVNEMQSQSPGSAYGTWIVSTDGFSDSLERFSGEVPIFAVHGTYNTSLIGSDVSNGCVRVPNEIIDQIAATVPLGTPVDVVA